MCAPPGRRLEVAGPARTIVSLGVSGEQLPIGCRLWGAVDGAGSCPKKGAQGSSLDETPPFRLRLWLQSRCSSFRCDPAGRIGHSKIGPVARTGKRWNIVQLRALAPLFRANTWLIDLPAGHGRPPQSRSFRAPFQNYAPRHTQGNACDNDEGPAASASAATTLLRNARLLRRRTNAGEHRLQRNAPVTDVTHTRHQKGRKYNPVRRSMHARHAGQWATSCIAKTTASPSGAATGPTRKASAAIAANGLTRGPHNVFFWNAGPDAPMSGAMTTQRPRGSCRSRRPEASYRGPRCSANTAEGRAAEGPSWSRADNTTAARAECAARRRRRPPVHRGASRACVFVKTELSDVAEVRRRLRSGTI